MYHKKTAEERFNMLARGWLAYPVTSIHSQLPPKSGCICQHIPRFANNFYNRSSAVDSLLLQPTPGRQANLGLHLSNRPSAVASPIKKPALINGLRQRRDASKKPPKSGCICHPSVCKSNDTHTNAITLRIIYPTVLRRLPPSEKTPSSTHCANYPFLISPTTTYLFFQQKH